jgi:hypothetical protein
MWGKEGYHSSKYYRPRFISAPGPRYVTAAKHMAFRLAWHPAKPNAATDMSPGYETISVVWFQMWGYLSRLQKIEIH